MCGAASVAAQRILQGYGDVELPQQLNFRAAAFFSVCTGAVIFYLLVVVDKNSRV